ncbi:hypothetical protein Tco_0877290 [Tanacetum coccineum]|uniref:Uncharacterized protein n=1 Tax=Tanacetum coccineum TaxID=301880 RepID=A0ABQ5BZX6_9ASTR
MNRQMALHTRSKRTPLWSSHQTLTNGYNGFASNPVNTRQWIAISALTQTEACHQKQSANGTAKGSYRHDTSLGLDNLAGSSSNVVGGCASARAICGLGRGAGIASFEQNERYSLLADLGCSHHTDLGELVHELKLLQPPRRKGLLYKSWVNLQQQYLHNYLYNNHRTKAKTDVDHQLVERLQAQEQEELSIEEKATLFQQLLEKRRKHFTAKRAEEKRNKPPTKAQQRKIMYTCLKNMEGYKLKDLKLKHFDSIQEMFDRAFKRVNTFEDFRTELVEGKEKRAGT